MTHGSGNGHGHANGSGHEHREVTPGLLIMCALGLAVTVTITCFVVLGLFNYFKTHQEPNQVLSPMANPAALPPEPRLQIEGTVQIQELREKEDHVLNSYAWVDQKSGAVRVPIDKAMDLLLQRGLPVRNYSKAGAGSGR